MAKNVSILALLAIIIALPFIFRQPPPQGDWRPGDPELVIVSPHNEAIRYEFALKFSKWYGQRHKRADGSSQAVKIDWRNIGGTTEISRYLASEYAAATQAWWQQQGKPWVGRAGDDLTASVPPAADPTKDIVAQGPAAVAQWQKDRDLSADIYTAYRGVDKPDQISCGIDLFFGGGEFDHSAAFRSGFAVPCVELLPPELFKKDGVDLIPKTLSGETWRSPSVMGNVVSTFGIIYNFERLNDLGIHQPPSQWKDLADYAYFGQVGLADPTKSGSTAKAFEMIVHQQMHDALAHAGYSDAVIATNEAAIDAYAAGKGKAYVRGDVPEALKPYQATLEQGFLNGLYLIQEIGANARYFTDSAAKVPIDVSMGDAAVGMAIDFYGRFQAQASRSPDGKERMAFVTPIGGTSVSVDPISLLRGAPAKQVAVEFIEFVLSEDGQQLWNGTPGSPGGPEKYALRRLPIRRTFYPSTQPWVNDLATAHDANSTDNLADASIDPYQVAKNFTYYKRWTNDHFFFIRDYVKAMCMDSDTELKKAWWAVHQAGRPTILPTLGRLPSVHLIGRDGKEANVPIEWKTAPDIRKKYDMLDVSRAWVIAFRDCYADVAAGKLSASAKFSGLMKQ